MSATPPNPFVLPGFGQSGAGAANPLLASLEMMRQAFAGLAGPAGMNSGLTPSLNPEELERKIAELKSVENWLKLNLSMLSSTIQGLEVQAATIATLKSFMAASSAGLGSRADQGSATVSPTRSAGWPMNQAPATTAAPANTRMPEPQAVQSASRDGQASAASSAGANGVAPPHAPPAAAQAWWDMLQQQFGQVAAATASSLASKAPTAASAKPSAAAKVTKKTSKKVATKKPL
ncbi:MAG: transcriptional regulator [Alcaligenaceae bacterium]|nr:MAG: transcriptional regulator [Alcaligenaceae bacterium]